MKFLPLKKPFNLDSYLSDFIKGAMSVESCDTEGDGQGSGLGHEAGTQGMTFGQGGAGVLLGHGV